MSARLTDEEMRVRIAEYLHAATTTCPCCGKIMEQEAEEIVEVVFLDGTLVRYHQQCKGGGL